MEAVAALGEAVLSVGMPVLFFVCLGTAVRRRSRSRTWVPVAAVAAEWGVFAHAIVWWGPTQWWLLAVDCAVSSTLLLVSAGGGIPRDRWRLVLLFAGILIIAPVMAWLGTAGVYSLFQ